jgi:HD-GYP domain-containing protein (c-di-GMP phosphodiesterase class II)
VLHDIGKIGISDRVLSKPGPLDADEWQEMYTHPEIGARLLSRPEFDDLRAWILAHHERPDGLGYPHALSGGDIPLEARILAVGDAYEAMTADRVYRASLGEAAARAELEAGAGTQFDAGVVRAFLRALDTTLTRRLRRVA